MTDDTEARWNAETAPAGVVKPASGGSVFDHARPRFDELGELGRGGMGRVAEARDRVLDRTVAIKHMLATDGLGLARFEREVRITARLQHPGIVPILDAGRDDDGHPYYVMRKIDGVALADRVVKRSVRDRLALVPNMLTAVDAVAYAHAQGIVHRDIKPWNILLGSFGEALMIDWGLARDLNAQPITEPPEHAGGADPALTRLGSAYGTPGFMSPEQARGEAADRRADVYSLGATLYFVLAGTTPFAGAEATAIIDKVAAGALPDLAKIPPEVPVELVAIVTKALAANPDARYTDAGELADDLRRFLAGQLVAAHRYTPWARVAKWVRKHRLVAAISAAAIVVIAGGGVWSITRIVTERDHARDAQSLAETRADDLVVDRARSLVQSDPTSAIAVLRGLPASSPQWPVAREIVRAAMAGGIERRIAQLSNRVTALAFSPHGRLASAAMADSNGPGEIRVHDVVRGTSTAVANVGVSYLAWLDEHTVVAWDFPSARLEIIDPDVGRVTSIPIAAFTAVTVDNGHAIVRRTDGSVVSFGADGVLTVLADGGVDSVDATAGRIVMVDRKHMTIIDKDGTRRERAIDIPTRIFHVRLAHSGKRVAIHAYRAIYEWAVDSDDAPLSWLRRTDAETHVLYAGDQLLCWSADGTGVAELHADRILTRWLTLPSGEIGVEPAWDATTALFVTHGGRIAYANELGVVELPHRPEAVARVAYDEPGRRLAIGTDAGDVEIVELSSAIPETRRLLPGDRLYAVDNERLVFGHETTDNTPTGVNFNALDRLEIVELDTNRHHWLPHIGLFATVAIDHNAIVAIGGPASNMVVVVTDLDGKEMFRADHVGSTEHLGHVAFIAASGDVVELDDAWRPHVIAHLRDPQMYALHETRAGVVATKVIAPAEASVIDASGSHPLALPLHEPPNSFYTSADGTWWVVENYARLWRIPEHGIATQIPLPENIRQLKEFGDHVYANGKAKIFELALDGTLLRSTSSVGLTGYFDTGYGLTTGEGVVVVMPSANVRRVLRLPREPNRVSISHVDARIIAASIPDDTGDVVAIWRDPVPASPADIPAYIERLTNAHLDPGSDELRWDAP